MKPAAGYGHALSRRVDTKNTLHSTQKLRWPHYCRKSGSTIYLDIGFQPQVHQTPNSSLCKSLNPLTTNFKFN